MRAKDAAAYLGLTTKALATWRVRGIGPPFRRLQGGLIFYAQQDLDEWVQQSALVQSTEEERQLRCVGTGKQP
jgi:hypothetical protein